MGNNKYIFSPNEVGQALANDAQNFFNTLRNYQQNPQQIPTTPTIMQESGASAPVAAPIATNDGTQIQDTNNISNTIVNSRKRLGTVLIIMGAIALSIWCVMALQKISSSGVGAIIETWYAFLLGIVLIIRGLYEKR